MLQSMDGLVEFYFPRPRSHFSNRSGSQVLITWWASAQPRRAVATP